MRVISFYPGPSRVYSDITKYIYEAYMHGILAINHRSDEFMELMAGTKEILYENLHIPKNYQILFTSSATECWEIFGQSMIRGKSQHFFNGAFGEKWAGHCRNLGIETINTHFDIDGRIPVHKIEPDAEWICITHSETSNGTGISHNSLKLLNKERTPDQLIAIDATSSMGGVDLDFNSGDFWFASVQKCFGLPAGLAILIVSDRAIQKAQQIHESSHYNSLLNILKNSQNNQTHYTPNILDIYLLYRTQKKSGDMRKVSRKVENRYKLWTDLINDLEYFDWLVKDPELRSPTVMTLVHHDVQNLKKRARSHDIIIGNGYGKWKDSTIRIANFPAIKRKEIERFWSFLRKNSH